MKITAYVREADPYCFARYYVSLSYRQGYTRPSSQDMAEMKLAIGDTIHASRESLGETASSPFDLDVDIEFVCSLTAPSLPVKLHSQAEVDCE